jgi:hypothetical protein
MMSLYQQCIRALQNNIDSEWRRPSRVLAFRCGECLCWNDPSVLYDTGGVPFEILEPVLERCTPEQLLRIEEYNPVRSGSLEAHFPLTHRFSHWVTLIQNHTVTLLKYACR